MDDCTMKFKDILGGSLQENKDGGVSLTLETILIDEKGRESQARFEFPRVTSIGFSSTCGLVFRVESK